MARKPNAAPPRLDTDDQDDKDRDDLIIAADEDDSSANGADVIETDAADESVETLRAQLAEANARAEREAAARAEAEKRVDQASNAVADSNLRAIDNAIGNTVADKKAIMAEITQAKEMGDYAKEAEALDRLQTANIKLARLNEGKSELERRIEEAKEQEELQRDPVEGYIANAKLNPQGAAWIRQHPELITTGGNIDRQKLGELEAAHYLAVGVRNRLQPGTPEYFEFLENELLGNGQDAEEEVTPAPKPNGHRPPPAARPSRHANSVNRPSNERLPPGVERRPDGSYRMSAPLREAARISGLSDKEYLKNLLDLQKEGQLTH